MDRSRLLEAPAELSVCPIWTLQITLLISLVVLVYCGVVGNWDRYLWKVERTQWW